MTSVPPFGVSPDISPGTPKDVAGIPDGPDPLGDLAGRLWLRPIYPSGRLRSRFQSVVARLGER